MQELRGLVCEVMASAGGSADGLKKKEEGGKNGCETVGIELTNVLINQGSDGDRRERCPTARVRGPPAGHGGGRKHKHVMAGEGLGDLTAEARVTHACGARECRLFPAESPLHQKKKKVHS
jgi:hypothetical protein